ncbi:MAG: RsbRD N-terminal domain-containing protein [bacterium]|nr:RsbRD N-terminal domain-containing protein [bacterium]
MTLNDILAKNRESIINRWFDLIVDSYPQNTADFIKSEKNRFANPVGWTIKKGIEDIFEGIIQNKSDAQFFPILDDIIKIRAVQEFTPSEAISFIFLLKQAMCEKIAIENTELFAIESKIDTLASISLDIFMECREKIKQLKTNEGKK